MVHEKRTTRIARVQSLWETLIKNEYNFEIVHYNALLRVYVENKHTFSTNEFLAEIEKRGLEPTEYVFIKKYLLLIDYFDVVNILNVYSTGTHINC